MAAANITAERETELRHISASLHEAILNTGKIADEIIESISEIRKFSDPEEKSPVANIKEDKGGIIQCLENSHSCLLDYNRKLEKAMSQLHRLV